MLNTLEKPITSAGTILPLPQLRETVIDFVKDGLADHSVGMYCVGMLDRKGVNVITIYWKVLIPEFRAANPDIMNPDSDYTSAFEKCMLADLRATMSADGAMRHKFTSKETWLENVEKHKAGTAYETPKSDGCPHCNFYNMSEFGVTRADFKYFRKMAVQKEIKAFEPIAMLEAEPEEIHSIGLNVPIEEIKALEVAYTTHVASSSFRAIVIKMLDIFTSEDVLEYATVAKKQYTRINLSLTTTQSNKIRELANAREMTSGDVLRSMLVKHQDMVRKNEMSKFV